ncbi:MAG: GNAT family N-acetyltransferase [Magnetovibrio sp.]|nr:GNAT family N-acetyltransferase [Magnetovibrio sp.]
MPGGREAITVRVASSLAEVDGAKWDACAGASDPFCRHAFLSALEDSGSADGETGWLAQHLVIEDADGGYLAVAPLYLKNHSYGEYVFDWGWADAYERAGGRYYPKLQCAVPFTPVTGPRLMVAPGVTGEDADGLRRALAAAMVQVAEKLDVSSVHITFPTESEWRTLGDMGFLARQGQQFHWHNQDYADFDAFLATLTSRKRKQIRKERARVADIGLDIRALRGAEITERHWDAFYAFYRNTSDRKWGSAYLTREFFSLLGERAGDDVVLIYGEADGMPVCGALNMAGRDALYGRNWGAAANFKFLHFETCYYRAIDFAIEHGLKRVEAGAQGPHKIQRGYVPVPTYSAHWIADPGLRDAVARFLIDERLGIEAEMTVLAAHTPYRQGDP